MLVAGRGDRLDGLLEAPRHLLELPQVDRLDAVVVGHEAVELERQLVAGGGVDDGVVVGAGLDVGGREDADRVVRVERLGEGALDGDGALEAQRARGALGGDDDGLGAELVRDGQDGRVDGGGQVAAEQGGIGEGMAAASERHGLGQQVVPGLEARLAVLAVVAVALEGPLVDGVDDEAGGEGLDVDALIAGDIEEQLAGEDGAGALVGGAVVDDGRALDAPVERHGVVAARRGRGRAGAAAVALLAGRAAKGQRQRQAVVLLADGVGEVLGHLDGMVVVVAVMLVLVLVRVGGVGAAGDGVVARRGAAAGGGLALDMRDAARGGAQEVGDAVGHCVLFLVSGDGWLRVVEMVV